MGRDPGRIPRPLGNFFVPRQRSFQERQQHSLVAEESARIVNGAGARGMVDRFDVGVYRRWSGGPTWRP